MLEIKGGLLTRRWVDTKDVSRNRDLIVIPDSLQETFLQLCHGNKVSGHPGIPNSIELCRRNYYWPKMDKDFKLWVAACIVCNKNKAPHAYSRAPLKHILYHNFNDNIVIDHIVPEKEYTTPRGYRYILSITDSWSGYLVAVPVKTQSAEENINALKKHWVYKHGIPLEITADNAKGYRARLFTAMFKSLDCKTTFGLPYSCRTTGKAERSNRRINDALRAAVPEGKHRDWDLYLDSVTFALNCLKNRNTGYSSNYLVYGRELNTPLSIMADNQEPFEKVPATKMEYDSKAYEIHKNLKSIIKKVRLNAQTEYGYAQKHHDRNLNGPFFDVGDECFVLLRCPIHKFAPRWVGPYTINRKINDHLYMITLPTGEDKIFNICKLKKYFRNTYSPPRSVSRDLAPPAKTPEKPVVTRRTREDDSDSDSDVELLSGASQHLINPERAQPQVPVLPAHSSTVDVSDHSSQQDHAVVEDDHSDRDHTVVADDSSDHNDVSVEPVPRTPETVSSNDRSVSTPVRDTDDEVDDFYTPERPSPAEEPRRHNLRDRNSIRAPVRYQAGVSSIVKEHQPESSSRWSWLDWLDDSLGLREIN